MAAKDQKCPAEIASGIQTFDSSKLKQTETHEKNLLPTPEAVQLEKQELCRLESIEKFSKDQLKQVNMTRKENLPDAATISQEKTIQKVPDFDKSQLKPAETIVKNPLPDKETIAAEKRASVGK